MTPLPKRLNRKTSQQTALVDGKIDEIGIRYWITPPELMQSLQKEFNFNFDACPFPRPAGLDNLREEWGSPAWMNPPICKGQSISKWVRKAVDEAKKGKTVVAVLPFPRWMRYILEVDAEFRFYGPIKFLNAKGQQSKSEGGGHIPDIIVVMKPKGVGGAEK